MRFEGRVGLVTGASRGIGRATAIALARDGADVGINYRSHTDEALEVVAEIEQLGRKAVLLQADVSDQEAVEAMVARTTEELGRLDLFVSNAAYSDRELMINADMDGFRRTINVSMWGAFYGLRASAQQMVQQGEGGSIVLVSSTGSYTAFRGLTSYGGAKGGVDQMCRQLVSEWVYFGIRVNAVNPGFMTNHMRRSDERYDAADLTAAVEARTPVGRRGAPGGIAGPVIFLALDASSYVTGHIMPIDGGYGIQGTP